MHACVHASNDISVKLVFDVPVASYTDSVELRYIFYQFSFPLASYIACC